MGLLGSWPGEPRWQEHSAEGAAAACRGGGLVTRCHVWQRPAWLLLSSSTGADEPRLFGAQRLHTTFPRETGQALSGGGLRAFMAGHRKRNGPEIWSVEVAGQLAAIFFSVVPERYNW